MLSVEFGEAAKKFLASLPTLPERFSRGKDRASTKVLQTYADRVKDAIISQTLQLAPLSDGWAARKRREGKDPRILISTKGYVDSIRVEGDGVVADANKKNFHENATKSSPARPVWGPVLDGMQIRDIGGIFAEELFPVLKGDK